LGAAIIHREALFNANLTNASKVASGPSSLTTNAFIARAFVTHSTPVSHYARDG
jgi:hypothetical protein